MPGEHYLHGALVRESFKAPGRDEDILEGIRVTADAGLHSEANLKLLQDNKIDGKIDTDQGRYRYSLRLGTVEPVFADINHATGLRRFSLRGQRKVNAQWMMYCLAHNIGKIQRFGDIGRWKKEPKAKVRQ